MVKILVTVVGNGTKDTGKYKVAIGDRVLLKKEPENEFDAKAIHVFLEDESESVGYVANSPNTIQENCQSALQIHNLFEITNYAKIVNSTKVRYRNGRESNAYICELEGIEANNQKGETINMAQEIKFKLAGGKTVYPNKFKLADELKKGIQPSVKLVSEGDKIVAYFDNGLCGYVDNRKQDDIYTGDELKHLITEEKVAKITSQVATNFIGVLRLGENELKKKTEGKSLKDAIDWVTSEGLATADEVRERVTYMEKFGVTEKQMTTLFQSYKVYDSEVAKRINKPKTLYQDSSGILKKAIAYMNIKRNLLFEGDRGVGKNVLVETLSWLYKRPLYEFSVNSQHDNNSLLGGKTIESEVGEDGVERNKMSYDPDVIIQAAEVGGILNFDEFNTSFGHVMSLFNSLLDDRRRIQVPGYKNIVADDNFMAISTQNKEYQGTFENNEATIDRFVPILFPTLKSIEDVLQVKVPGIPYSMLSQCQKLFAGIKKNVEDGEISEKAISIRGFIDACTVAVEQDIPLKDALIDNVANKALDTDERKTIRDSIEDIIG
ncbi:AAA family ATPase (plasmid) [Aneurinibacillus sp. Ricciae_BoGa-3]|uniref:AAA family ATPase n=1 Tax=Aneurinibacillus sp. Ricciae_BoGa-3 TaxID=3022697 RepID=UPI0023423374|nr:AAA family ATPase [Aneurinibacillus sp. Ricciae_BoGa-3]WCK56964.1 AAA family ATPase [Aneurinibacillus sp. Ricciae_BoGa-3]